MSKRTQLYTTAPETYDGFGTKTVRIVGRIKGKDVRLVETPEEHATWQLMRYHSGAVYMVADAWEWQEVLRYKLAEPLGDVYRDFHIEKVSGATQLGYRTATGKFGKGRSTSGYLVHYPDGGSKWAATKKEAKEYIDSYQGTESLGDVARYDMQKLRARVAEKLGWSVKDTQKFSLQMLREMVKDKSPKLAHEISNAIRSGDYLR